MPCTRPWFVCVDSFVTREKVLDIPDTADESDIRRAYRRKALKTHPDVNASPNAKAECVLNTASVELLGLL